MPDIANVLSKLSAKPEVFDGILDADEIATLTDWDFNSHAKGIRDAAEARATRKVSALRADLETQLESTREELEALQEASAGDGGTDTGEASKIRKEYEKLTKQVEALTADNAKLSDERNTLNRNGRLSELRTTAGISFVDGVDKTIVNDAWSRAFAEIDTEDLTDETTVKPLVEAFRESNAAIIRAKQSAGTGGRGNDGTGGSTGKPEDIENLSAGEREKQLQEQRKTRVTV